MSAKTSIIAAAERTEGDCLRMAVTSAYSALYGFSYADTPAIHPHEAAWQREWERWATDRDLKWWASYEWAPIHRKVWIATVDSLTNPGVLHAVAMNGARLFFDPNTVDRYTHVGPPDVRMAQWLLPAGQPPLTGGPCWRITRPSGRGSNFRATNRARR